MKKIKLLVISALVGTTPNLLYGMDDDFNFGDGNVEQSAIMNLEELDIDNDNNKNNIDNDNNKNNNSSLNLSNDQINPDNTLQQLSSEMNPSQSNENNISTSKTNLNSNLIKKKMRHTRISNNETHNKKQDKLFDTPVTRTTVRTTKRTSVNDAEPKKEDKKEEILTNQMNNRESRPGTRTTVRTTKRTSVNDAELKKEDKKEETQNSNEQLYKKLSNLVQKGARKKLTTKLHTMGQDYSDNSELVMSEPDIAQILLSSKKLQSMAQECYEAICKPIEAEMQFSISDLLTKIETASNKFIKQEIEATKEESQVIESSSSQKGKIISISNYGKKEIDVSEPFYLALQNQYKDIALEYIRQNYATLYQLISAYELSESDEIAKLQKAMINEYKQFSTKTGEDLSSPLVNDVIDYVNGGELQGPIADFLESANNNIQDIKSQMICTTVEDMVYIFKDANEIHDGTVKFSREVHQMLNNTKMLNSKNEKLKTTYDFLVNNKENTIENIIQKIKYELKQTEEESIDLSLVMKNALKKMRNLFLMREKNHFSKTTDNEQLLQPINNLANTHNQFSQFFSNVDMIRDTSMLEMKNGSYFESNPDITKYLGEDSK